MTKAIAIAFFLISCFELKVHKPNLKIETATQLKENFGWPLLIEKTQKGQIWHYKNGRSYQLNPSKIIVSQTLYPKGIKREPSFWPQLSSKPHKRRSIAGGGIGRHGIPFRGNLTTSDGMKISLDYRSNEVIKMNWPINWPIN